MMVSWWTAPTVHCCFSSWASSDCGWTSNTILLWAVIQSLTAVIWQLLEVLRLTLMRGWSPRFTSHSYWRKILIWSPWYSWSKNIGAALGYLNIDNCWFAIFFSDGGSNLIFVISFESLYGPVVGMAEALNGNNLVKLVSTRKINGIEMPFLRCCYLIFRDMQVFLK